METRFCLNKGLTVYHPSYSGLILFKEELKANSSSTVNLVSVISSSVSNDLTKDFLISSSVQLLERGYIT